MSAVLEEKISSLWDCVRSDSPQRHTRAAEIASDIYSLCIEQITEAELAYCSSVLLNEKEGVVKFLLESATLDDFVNCKDELLHLLTDYVRNVGTKVIQYAVSIKDVCVSLFSRDKTAKVKNATFPLLISVLELCGKSEIAEKLNVPKIAEKYFQAALQPTKHSSTVRSGIYLLLGVLCQHFPEHMIEHSQRLVGIYTRTLKAEMVSKKGKKPELPIIAGCLKGLTAYLYNFTQSASEGSVHAREIYNYVRKAIDPAASLARYDVPRSGLALLAEHAEQFKEYLAKDTEQMYSSLYQWSSHNNRECKFAGLKAMEAFFKQVSHQIAESGDRSGNVKIYKEFMMRFRKIIDDPQTQNKELAVAIKGFGFFAKPCRVYGTKADLQYMFNEMIQRSEHLFVSAAEVSIVEDVLIHLPTFMEALSSITAELEELSDGFLLALERLVVFLFENYPRLPKHISLQSSIALLRLTLAVSTKPVTFQRFMSHIVFQGLVRSCSHPVVIESGDAVVSTQQQPSIDNGTPRVKVPSYKDYIDVWTQLMDPGKLQGIGAGDYTTMELRPSVHLACYGEFVQAVLAIVKKLDLSSSPPTATLQVEEGKTTPTDENTAPSGSTTPTEDPSSDPLAGVHPNVPRDFQILINLVELCRKLFPTVTPHLFSNWVFVFSREIITMATQYPLVSGFYKLLACVLNICKKIKYFEGVSIVEYAHDDESQGVAMETDTEETQCYLLYRKFVKEVAVRMQQYKDDLLSSCLQLVLSIPTKMVNTELDTLMPTVELSLKLGIGYLPLAATAITALESWMQQVPSDMLYSVVGRLLPLLDDYLQTSSKMGGESKDVSDIITVGNVRGKRLPVKVLKQWKEGIQSSGNSLSAVRERILFLLGSLGGVVNRVLLERGSSGATLSQSVSWDSGRRLEFPVPFSDLKPSIFVDPFLPRVCELCVSSSDRQTKVAACEFLHAAVLFIIGKSAQPVMQKKSPMTKIFKKVFPVLLQLGCDVERVAEQLFRPLVLQIIHWFTRNTQYESPDTMALLDAILEGIEHPTDASLRDFSAQCVREFLLWSIKQTSKKQQERSPINTKSLIKRIYSMASHPSTTKRLGAALAINSVYPVFREEATLVDMFVIEMLVVMVNSLKIAHRDQSSLGTVDQCILAIGHIAKIIKAKASLLCTTSKSRRVPRGLDGANLKQLVMWLLSQTGCPETDARHQCIKLFTVFAPPATKVLNIEVWIRRTVESDGGHFFVSRFERASSSYGGGISKTPTLVGTVSLTETQKWLDCLQASLDCYIWVLKDQFVSPSEVFQGATKTSNLFKSVSFFLSKLAHGSFESSMSVETSRVEEDQYGSGRSSVVGKIFSFVEILLVKHTTECSQPFVSSIWCPSLWSVLFSSVFDPVSIGLQHGDYTTRQLLADKGVKVLQAIMKHLVDNSKEAAVAYFGNKLSEKRYNLLSRLPISSSNKSLNREHLSIETLLKGHLYLADADLLKPALARQGVEITSLLSQLIFDVTELTSSMATVGNRDNHKLGDPTKIYTTKLILRLALHFYEKVSSVIQLILTPKKGSSNGLVLYLKHADIINAKLITELDVVVTNLLSYASTLPQNVSTILNGLIDHLQKDKLLRRHKLPSLCNTLISNWANLSCWWTDLSIDCKLSALNILQKMLSAQPKLLESSESGAIVDMYCQLISDQTNTLSFKTKALEILSPFMKISDDVNAKMRSSLSSMIAHQFPLNSSELPKGSPMHNDYIAALDKLLECLSVSGSLVVLELIISIACRETKHVHEVAILNSLEKFIGRAKSPAAVEALSVSFNMFINERDYPTESRRGIGERVCCTLLRMVFHTSLIEFYVQHIVQIMDIVEAKVLRSSDPKLEDQLVSKLCCFQFLEILYNRMTSSFLSSMDSKINTSYCKGKPSTGKELTQAMTKSGHAAKSEDLHGDKTHYELRRQYHCHAYNMLIAVISCTQSKPQFYQGFLFKEDLMKGQCLLDNLIDPGKEYHFEAELDAPITRKKQLMSIRDELNESQTSPDSLLGHTPFGSSPPINMRYISSVYLAQSSLSSDVSLYDFSHSVAPGIRQLNDVEMEGGNATSSYIVSEEQLEEDNLNSHECMVPMMTLLDHMSHNKITPSVEMGEEGRPALPDMPPWMSLLHKKMSEGTTERNVRLFIARLIVNRPKIFEPYAKHWLLTLSQLIISGNTGGEGLHYFVVDILATMLSWTPVAVLEDRYLASRLMEFVIEHCNHDNRSVFRNNLEIAKTLVECWRDHIQIPTKLIYSSFSNPNRSSKNNRAGIQLLGIVVANDLPPYDLSTASTISEDNYYRAFASNMSNKYKEVYEATGEVLGMLLFTMQNSNHSFLDSLKDIVINQLLVLTSPTEQNEDRFILCLHKIQLHYPRLVQRFVDKLVFMLPMLQGVFRSQCLEILQSQADIQPQFYLQLKNAGFHNMLLHRDEATQVASLKIVQGMLNQLDIEDIAQLLPSLVSFSSHSSVQCRVTMYNILMTVYNMLSSSGDTDISVSSDISKIVLVRSRDQLLAGLSDDAEQIRLKMYEFWNQDANLASGTINRLSQILGTLYSTKTEQNFLYHATNLLLELTSRSPDFNRSIFDTPLSECKFEDYKSIDLSWHQRHLQMTPLFAATQMSQSGSQSDTGMGTGVLRATQQALAFTPTQDAGGYSWMTPAAQSIDASSVSFTMGTTSQTQDSKQSSLLFTRSAMRSHLGNPLRVSSDSTSKTVTSVDLSEEDTRRHEVLKLKRRFLRSREASNAYFAKSEIRKKSMREEHRRHQRAARQNQVVMYRKYRDGELPDIQIKHSEIIRPLQALAQFDSGLARLLFASLFNAIFSEVDHHLSEEEAEATKTAVREGINTILESSQQYYPPFVGSLQDICYHESQLSLVPSNITASCLVSNQELIGIMLLEKQLLVNVGNTPAKSAKRSKGAQAVSEATETWVEASRLYKSLSDYDVVHGVFSNLEGIQQITKQALQSEERGEYREALRLYKQALGTSGETWRTAPTQVEEDMWEDSLLSCYRHLTKWSDLETASTNNVDDPWTTSVWEDPYYQEHYLSYIIQSKLKLWCLEGSDRGLDGFLEKSFQNESSRLILQSRYAEQVAMAYIVKGDQGKAKYYHNLSLTSFQQDWSASGSGNSCDKMQCLQRLTEMKEFLELISHTRGSNIGHENILGLVDKWKNRYPDSKMDSIPAWDDIITNRQVMFGKLSEKVGELSVKRESGSTDTSVMSINRSLSLEYNHMCMKMAEAACVQLNFPVSKKYLHIVEKSIQKDFSDDKLLKLKWLHGIADMRIRQRTLDPSPSQCDTLVSLAHKLIEVESQLTSFLSVNKSIASEYHNKKARTLDLLAEIFSYDEEDDPIALRALPFEASVHLKKFCGYSQTENMISPSEVSQKLWCLAISSFNSSIKSGTERSPSTGKPEPTVNSLEEMASFCDKILRKQYDEDIDTQLDTTQFPSVVIAHTLKAMSLGSKRAIDQFPRILQLLQEFPETVEQFVKKSSSVPCWMFISWISQMVALLDKNEGHAISEILMKLANTYPQALCYPFKVSSKGFKFTDSATGKKNRSNFEKLRDKLHNNVVDDFIEALNLLNSPELVCKDMLDEIRPLLQQSKKDTTAIHEVWKSLYDQLLQDGSDESPSSLYGTPSVQRGRKIKEFHKTYYKKIVDRFGQDGSKIQSMQGTQFNKIVSDLYDTMRQSLRKQEGHNLLKEYSPWLESFQSSDYSHSIEVPGQYDGKSKPIPEYHAKIAGFDSKILVLGSMRKPKRLTIIGDNSREYMFLVKGGEDLRHDQRIEQLFDVMNGILCEDAACSQRQLRVRTYQVIPMTTRVGLIEWVKNTKPLKEFLTDELTDNEKKRAQNATTGHMQWVEKLGGYPEMYKKAKQSEVEKKFLERVALIPWDLLRRGFLKMSASPEAFVLLRSHFIKTFSTANICQYVLGIGDRHLSNFMVDLNNGGLVPIDFGHAFHTATQFLPFPELMPMRLTPQFTNLCLPHKHSGQLRSCMIHTMRALHSSPSALLNTMDVFIKEPSVDWKNNARKQAAALKVGAGENESNWYPREKIRISKKKLQGYNSSHLMLVDLKHGHGKKAEYQCLQAILLGDKRNNLRARVKERCSDVEEQVDCLIDHATDPNILGRTYFGWEPWM